MDLNYESHVLRMPTKMEIIKKFCCFCCAKPLYMSASMPVTGYVSGQSIKISVELSNQTDVLINRVCVSLKKVIQYTSQTPRYKLREEIVNMAEVRSGSVDEYSNKSFDLELPIPPVPPTNSSYCRVVTVSYVVQIKANTSGMHKDPYIRIPVTIGTIPLASTIPAITNGHPTAPPQQNVSPSAPAAYMALDQKDLVNLRKLCTL